MNIFYESEDSSKDQNLSLKRGFKSNIHSCFKCNKVFKKLAYLKEHEYVHTGEVRYFFDLKTTSNSKLNHSRGLSNVYIRNVKYLTNEKTILRDT